MKKAVLIELIKENLAGGDAPAPIRGKYDDRVIEKYLEMGYDDLVADIYKECFKTNNYSLLDNFGKAYKVVILKDEDRGEYYVELAISVVPLPDNQGIRLVSPYKDQSQAFDYIDNNSQHVFRYLFNNVVSPTGIYYTELPRIYVSNFPTALIGKELMVKVIPPFNGLDENDDVFLPGGNNLALFDRVYEIMFRKNKTPQDDYDNNNSKQI